MTYRCNDTTLGINRNNTQEISFECVIDEPNGRFNIPRENGTWPACLEMTTTPHPAIPLAFGIVRRASDRRCVWRGAGWSLEVLVEVA